MKTRTVFNNEYEVNSEYVSATKLSESILEQIIDIRDKIDELEKLTEKSWCEQPSLLSHRMEMIECMKKESMDLKLSLEAYYAQVGE